MLKTICYKSQANANLKLLEFEALFNQTQLKNNSHNITGVLVKRDDVFFQILEGNPIIIDTVYEEIKKDRRHFNILELLNKSISQLSFKSFDIGYAVIKDTDTLYGLQKFVSDLQQNNIENSPLFLQIIEELLSEH
ncbi:BLUF domain-containing protein [Olleya sp. Ti.3.14]|uniref:BLUF domain-containing protein n=1 Tax=Olleya sp. Ti.3.14 TaxID=3121297 RepID=UPI00311E3F55